MPNTRLQPILDDGRYFEAPRWRDGRLWLVDSVARTLLTVGPDGSATTACTVAGFPAGLGFLEGGGAIVTDMFRRKLVRCEGGRAADYADLSTVAAGTIDDMVIDGRGRIYVGDLGFNMAAGLLNGPYGRIILLAPGEPARTVADGLNFPNGIAVSDDHQTLVVAETTGGPEAAGARSTPGNLTRYRMHDDGSLQFADRFAEVETPDGICFDREGATWASLLEPAAFVRVARDGQILDRIPVPDGRRAVACVLGGEPRRTLYCISTEGRTPKEYRSYLDATLVEVPGAGYP
jgi:sugar lactone lactonase YvrE